MKRFALVVGVLVAVVAFQSTAQVKIEYGVKAGLNVSGLALTSWGKLSDISYNNRTGFHLGGFANFRLTKKFGVQPELVYSTQGQNFSSGSNSPFAFSNYSSQLNYLNVPVLLKYYLGDGFSVYAGPQLGFLVSAKGDLLPYSNGSPSGQPQQNQDLKSYVNSNDLSLAFGIAIKLPAGLDLNFRYNSGLSDINKNSGTNNTLALQPSFSTAKTRNQVIQISVGYKLSKKKK